MHQVGIRFSGLLILKWGQWRWLRKNVTEFLGAVDMQPWWCHSIRYAVRLIGPDLNFVNQKKDASW